MILQALSLLFLLQGLDANIYAPPNERVPVNGSSVGGAFLKVFIIPHTHDDVGWLSTVDEYYIQQVQFILDTTTQALLDNPARKFTYVEVGFFKRWFDQQTPTKQAQVRALQESGQLSFNLGGWCMNDEAVTDYNSEINQMTEGAQYLLRNFGPKARPTVGWHVDPFGHSSATGSMWADVGLDAFGLNRIDYRLKDAMKTSQTLEFVWRTSTSLGNSTDIWVHVLDSHYCTPAECNYDGNLFINTDSSLPTYGVNAQQQADDFMQMARGRSVWYRHDAVLIPFGCDFSHQNAQKSFKQLDVLINYINANPDRYNAEVLYSNFADYVQYVNSLNMVIKQLVCSGLFGLAVDKVSAFTISHS
jgi:lysosomal alpha-mannosidase